MRVLITSVGTATSVNLIRYFKKANDYVVGTDINPLGFTAGSLLVGKFYKVGLAESNEFFGEICNIIEKEKIDVFIPINDIEVYKISLHIDEIKCRCVIPNKDTIEIVRDKFICSKMMMEKGIPTPEIFDKERHEKRILRDRIGVGSKGIKIIEAEEDTPIYEEGEAFVQKYVEGEEYTVDVLSDLNGNPSYIIPRKRLEVKSGVATKVKVENDGILIGYVEKILGTVCLPGFSNIQFIKDNEGNYWFVEINCRFAGCGAASLAVTNDYIDEFKRIVNGESSRTINLDVRWNAIVTRYYEEVVYEEGIC